ncbi:MAG TPA: SDR family oxidoreductase [Opitutaceae bacterium]
MTTTTTSLSSNTPALDARLDGKAYLVTGGTTGMGLAAAEQLAREGARVFITGRTPQTLADAAQRLGDRGVALENDTASLKALPELIRSIRAHVDHLDGVFINAGVATFQPLENVTPKEFDELFTINVRGAFFTLQALLPLLREGSSVVFNSSIAGRLAMSGGSVYAATKAALTSLGRSLAVELAPRGIRVNVLSPGPVTTPILAKAGVDATMQENLAAGTLLKRWGRPEEVARLVRFLLTDDSSFVVGEEIVIDGGYQLT